MHLILLLVEIFLAILWLYCIFGIMFPQKPVELAVQKAKNAMKFYAFEGDIKPTEKSVKIMRVGHILVFSLITIYLGVIYYLIR